MRENFYALLICILKPVTVEQSFLMMNGVITMKQNRLISDTDLHEMANFKEQGMNYKEIGEMFGISAGAAFNRIKRYKGEYGHGKRKE